MRIMKTVLASLFFVGLTAVVGGCGNPADDVPTAIVTKDTPAPAPIVPTPTPTDATTPETIETTPAPAETAPVEPPPAAGPVSYTIDANSSIGFIGSNLIGQREGGFSLFNGTVTTEGDNVESAKIDLTIDMKSVFSDSDVLTGKLKGDAGFFETDKFPTATFKSSSVTKAEDGYTVQGMLNLHGVEKEIAFPAKISIADKTLTATSEFSINRQDWNINYEGAGDFAVRDEVVIKLDINAVAS